MKRSFWISLVCVGGICTNESGGSSSSPLAGTNDAALSRLHERK